MTGQHVVSTSPISDHKISTHQNDVSNCQINHATYTTQSDTTIASWRRGPVSTCRPRKHSQPTACVTESVCRKSYKGNMDTNRVSCGLTKGIDHWTSSSMPTWIHARHITQCWSINVCGCALAQHHIECHNGWWGSTRSYALGNRTT